MSRVAAVQMTSGTDVATNLRDAGRLVAEAAATGAQLVVLPENFAAMPEHENDRLALAETAVVGPIQDTLSALARRHQIWLVAGTMALRERDSDRVRSACLVFDTQGTQAARYDKIHLFDVSLGDNEHYRESATIEPGTQATVVDTPLGRIGLAVCYDLRFPELFRHMLDQGAEIFTVPSAFTATTGRAHWDVLVRARAIENLAYVVAAGQSGQHANGRSTHGNSMVVDPWGVPLARREQGPGIVTAEVDRARLAQIRRKLPSIEHRRL